MIDQELTYPAIVYLQPDVAEFFSFAAWRMTKKECLLVNSIPKSVYSWIRPVDLGLVQKLKTKMHPIMLRRYDMIKTQVKLSIPDTDLFRPVYNQ